MSETPEQYTRRILGYMEGKEPLAALAATAKKLDRLITGVSTARLRKRPAPEKWSVSEIVAHLGDAEIVGGFRMRLILGSPGAPIVAYDQNQSPAADRRDPRAQVQTFIAFSAATLSLVSSIVCSTK